MQSPAFGIRALTFGLALALGVSQTGCIKRTLLNGQAKAVREGSEALNELGDYQVARGAAQSGLAQLEGMHRLANDNADVLFMLTRSWTSYGFAFSQDDLENAEEGTEAYDDAKVRAAFAFNRAVKYSGKLLALRAEGFDGIKKSEKALTSWLKDNFDAKEDAPNLFWSGYAWMARASLLRTSDLVAELYVGVAMIKRSLELDPDYYNGNGYTALASYHARAKMAEPEESRRMFELVLQKTGHKSLLVQVSYAERYACVMSDRKLYDALINEALDFDLNSAPQNRLQNTIARRRALRATRKEHLENCGFDPAQPVVKKKSGTETGELSMEDFMKAGGADNSSKAGGAGANEKKPEPKDATPSSPVEQSAPPPAPGAKPHKASPAGAPKPAAPPPASTPKPAPKKPAAPGTSADGSGSRK